MTDKISAQTLRGWLYGDEELALLDPFLAPLNFTEAAPPLLSSFLKRFLTEI